MVLMPTVKQSVSSTVMTLSKAGIAIRRMLKDLDPPRSQHDLGQALGKSQGWVSTYLLRDTDSTLRRLWLENPAKIETLLDFLRKSPEQFEQETGVKLPIFSRPDNATTSRSVVYKLVPIRSMSMGGLPLDEEQYPVPVSLWRPGMEIFAHEGDSMVRDDGSGIHPGAYIFVDTNALDLRNRELFMFRIPGNGYVLKEARKINGHYKLVSWNPLETVLEPEEVEIVGHVYEVLGSLLELRHKKGGL